MQPFLQTAYPVSRNHSYKQIKLSWITEQLYLKNFTKNINFPGIP